QGNTGYDFLAIVNNVFTNSAAREPFTAFYEKLTGDKTSPEDQALEKKAYILHTHMQGELNNLVQLYQSLGLAGEDTEAKIKEAISRYLIGCPVYRYYDDAIPVMERDLGKNSPQLKQFYARCMQ